MPKRRKMARAEMYKIQKKKMSADICDAIENSTHIHVKCIYTYIQYVLAGLQFYVTKCMAPLEPFLAHNSTSIDVAQSKAKATATATATATTIT